MQRYGWITALTLALSAPQVGHALFHIAHISELDAAMDGDPGVQYVEIEMNLGGQTIVTNTILSAWSCGGAFLGEILVVPNDIPNGGNGVRWIMASTVSVGGIDADFVFDGGALPATCGQVCWGAPGFSAPDPASWSHDDPTEYTDCIAYGAYTGPIGTNAGTPSPLAANDPVFSLTRVGDTNDSAADFAHMCPSPENNDGQVGMLGGCTDPTTTTTMSPATTTTTTLPTATSEPLAGKKLLIKMKPGKPDKTKFLLIAKDTLSIGGGNGSADDPVTAGGEFTMSAGLGSVGGAFTSNHDLSGSWKYVGKEGAGKGYKWKSKTSPIRLVLIKANKVLKVKGKGSGLSVDLANDPNPVRAELRIGGLTYCMEFGGETKHVEGKKYLAKGALAPGSCP